MQDLISRQAAIDAAIEAADDWDGGCSKERERFIRDALEELPSAQPEIIRCKNCKHRHLDGMIWDCPFGLSGGEDFFCAYGAKDGDSDDE